MFGFKDYGGRGIQVCERWRHDFAAFLADMGPRPSPNHSIDRINNDGNYEPGNCRWATRREQASNKRSNRFLTIDGETLTITEWARRNGNKEWRIRRRVQGGWEPRAAVTTPALTPLEAARRRWGP